MRLYDFYRNCEKSLTVYTGLFCPRVQFAFFPSHFKWKIITYDKPVETKDHMISLSEN